MNLWVVNEYALTKSQAGASRHHYLADALKQHDITTTIIASTMAQEPRHGSRTVEIDAVRFVWLNHFPYNGNGPRRVLSMLVFAGRVLWAARRVGGRYHLPRPDVVVGSSPHPFAALAGFLLARRYRARFIFEVRDIWPLSLIELVGLSPRHPLPVLLRKIERFLYAHADAIIGLMDRLEDHVETVLPGRTRAPVIHVPNGIDGGLVAPSAELVDRADFRMVYVGSHGVPNDLGTALQAAAILQKEHPSTPRGGRYLFDFYGDGVSKSDLIAFALEHGLDNVTFHDPIPKPRVQQVLADADAALILWRAAPLYKFGVSANKLFDYLAAGRPVIMAIDTETNLIAQAGAGLLTPAEDAVAFADAIRALAETPLAERQGMAERGRRFLIENHTADRLAERYVDAIEAALARRR